MVPHVNDGRLLYAWPDTATTGPSSPDSRVRHPRIRSCEGKRKAAELIDDEVEEIRPRQWVPASRIRGARFVIPRSRSC